MEAVPAADLDRVEELLSDLENLDPADLTGPAAEIADLLGRLLEDPAEERL